MTKKIQRLRSSSRARTWPAPSSAGRVRPARRGPHRARGEGTSMTSPGTGPHRARQSDWLAAAAAGGGGREDAGGCRRKILGAGAEHHGLKGTILLLLFLFRGEFFFSGGSRHSTSSYGTATRLAGRRPHPGAVRRARLGGRKPRQICVRISIGVRHRRLGGRHAASVLRHIWGSRRRNWAAFDLRGRHRDGAVGSAPSAAFFAAPGVLRNG